MGDPVTMAMIGAGVGAVTNRRNPLQGALLGGALGGFGGAAMGAGSAASTAAMTGANPAVMGTAGMGVAPMTAGATYSAATPGMVANLGTATMPTYAATGGTTGLIPSMTAPVTMMDRLGAVGQFAKENPMVTQLGASAAKDIFSQQPQPPLQAGLLRGSQVTPQEQPQYAMARPQISLI